MDLQEQPLHHHHHPKGKGLPLLGMKEHGTVTASSIFVCLNQSKQSEFKLLMTLKTFDSEASA